EERGTQCEPPPPCGLLENVGVLERVTVRRGVRGRGGAERGRAQPCEDVVRVAVLRVTVLNVTVVSLTALSVAVLRVAILRVTVRDVTVLSAAAEDSTVGRADLSRAAVGEPNSQDAVVREPDAHDAVGVGEAGPRRGTRLDTDLRHDPDAPRGLTLGESAQPLARPRGGAPRPVHAGQPRSPARGAVARPEAPVDRGSLAVGHDRGEQPRARMRADHGAHLRD